MNGEKKEILQDSVTLSSEENLQENTPKVVQRNMQVEISTYNDAMEQLRNDGVDKNILFQRFLELICDVEGFSYAVLRKKVSITTTNNNYVQRQSNHHQSEDSGA